MRFTDVDTRGGGSRIFQQSRSDLKILDAGWVARKQFQTEDPQILGATVQKSSRMGGPGARDLCSRST